MILADLPAMSLVFVCSQIYIRNTNQWADNYLESGFFEEKRKETLLLGS